MFIRATIERSQTRNGLSVIALSALALLLSSCSTTSTEKAADDGAVGYRYWGYSQSSEDGADWVTAMEGPATTNPKDGSVEGWNYTFSAEGLVAPQAPSAAPDFQSLCGATPERSGKKRVGYVIEFGAPAIHPEGDSAPAASSGCAPVDVNATGLDVLNAVAQVRAGEGGFICGLNGFPTTDCGADAIPVPELMRNKR
jgi:hypothetical protein